jgi:hypothetical protein
VRNVLSQFTQGIHRGEKACCEHLESVRKLNDVRHTEHDYLYDCLSVLDAKAQALLAFDSILLVAASFGLPHLPPGWHASRVLVITSLVLAAVAALACLPVIWLTWTETDDLAHDELFIALLKVRNWRTLLYRISWLLAGISMICVVVGLVMTNEIG